MGNKSGLVKHPDLTENQEAAAIWLWTHKRLGEGAIGIVMKCSWSSVLRAIKKNKLTPADRILPEKSQALVAHKNRVKLYEECRREIYERFRVNAL